MPPQMLTEMISTASGGEVTIIEPANNVGSSVYLTMREISDQAIETTRWNYFWFLVAGEEEPTLSEREFKEQEEAFQQIPPLLLEQYRGQFVASRNGQIVDSDEDFVVLTHRFFETFGDVPVYITKIGDDEGIVIDTPFFD